MSNKTILVIDDDETIRTVVDAVLKQHDLSPVLASSGEEGLNIARTVPPDGIVLDRKMPGMDGDQVLKELKEDPETAHIPVIMLTSKNRITDVSECLELGACDYIVKPFDHDNFIIRVHNMLKRSS